MNCAISSGVHLLPPAAKAFMPAEYGKPSLEAMGRPTTPLRLGPERTSVWFASTLWQEKQNWKARSPGSSIGCANADAPAAIAASALTAIVKRVTMPILRC